MVEQKNDKSVSKVLQNLERLYKLTIEQELRFPFFKALHAYLEFALKEPILKSIIEEQMAQRNDQYKKINEAEEEAVKEMRLSKDKILSIIKKKKINASDFDRPSTFPVWNTNGKNVVEELEAIENKEIEFYSSQSYSGRLQAYLFDISAGLLKRGYGKELGNLVVPIEEYNKYYERINGTSGYFFAGNVNGNFIFSRNWPKTFEYKNLVERERVLKSWGAFEKAIQFMRAFHNVLTDTSTWKIQEIMSPYDYLLDEKDLVEVFHMTEDFYHISGQTREDSSRRFKGSNSPELDALYTPTFKNVLETIHSIFLQTIESENVEPMRLESGKKRKGIFIDNDNLCFDEKNIPVERGQKSMIGIFLDNAKVSHGDKLSQKGSDVSITKLVEVGGYTDNNAFRDGLKRLRAKIKKAGIPATIENTGTGKYQLVIKYQ